MIVVEVQNADGSWAEVSRYDAIKTYSSSRHIPPKKMKGDKMAREDCNTFARSYGRPTRMREAV